MNKVFVLRDKRILEAFLAFLVANWEAMSRTKHPMQVVCQPESTKRNLAQNRYYWNLLNQVSTDAWIEGRQYAAEVWHELAKRKFVGCVDMPGGGLMAMSTTDLSTKEFADYVTKVEAWAASELGVTFLEQGAA
jgi:hypothetical protein